MLIEVLDTQIKGSYKEYVSVKKWILIKVPFTAGYYILLMHGDPFVWQKSFFTIQEVMLQPNHHEEIYFWAFLIKSIFWTS